MNNPTSLAGKKILVAVTGSIAAVKSPILISQLIKMGAEVRCVITQSAAKLVSPLSLSTLSRHKCYQDKTVKYPHRCQSVGMMGTFFGIVLDIAI